MNILREVYAVFAGLLAIVLVLVSGLFLVPKVFEGRVLPLVHIGQKSLAGITNEDLDGVLRVYGEGLKQQSLVVQLEDKVVSKPLGELGVELGVQDTRVRMLGMSWPTVVKTGGAVRPSIIIDVEKLHKFAGSEFTELISPPKNATLHLNQQDKLELEKSRSGEGIDLLTFEQDLVSRMLTRSWHESVNLVVVKAAAEVQDHEVESARGYVEELLQNGLKLSFGDIIWQLKPFTVKRMLKFVRWADPQDDSNDILGVTFDREELELYLKTTIAPEVNQPAINARFEVSGDIVQSLQDKLEPGSVLASRVEQFAMPQAGQALNVDESADKIMAAVLDQQAQVSIVVAITEPLVKGTADMEALGIITLLTSGTSDFSGSPKNRVHNIKVGTARYHGLLLAPNEEFSFNEYLGPVDKAHGYKRELVILSNVTTPQYGGGLCQVSTTVFRAAIQAGLKIEQRRNHSYAVRYYGEPGFDATIYPPYTDLRFTNNTPGYILIQAYVKGEKLVFDFWGTDDGREVELAGPVSYGRQASGAVKATLGRKVVRNGEVIIDEVFYSSYKSPKLFPKVLSIDDPIGAAQTTATSGPAPKPESELVVNKEKKDGSKPAEKKTGGEAVKPIPEESSTTDQSANPAAG